MAFACAVEPLAVNDCLPPQSTLTVSDSLDAASLSLLLH
jgi:hypothetical protein